MAEKRLILHVGAPKCGSTALQTALAQNPDFGRTLGEKFRYAVIDRQGELCTGVEVRRRATRSLSGGAPSANARTLSALSAPTRRALAQKLNAALSETSIVLSQEGWLERPALFLELDLLSQIRAPIDVIAYVRPQPDFLNASWWQWGAWTQPSFERWMEAEKLPLCSWGDLLKAWQAFPNVRRVSPRLMADDVVGDFFALLGCPSPKAKSVNRSLPGIALRFLQRNRELRPGRGDVDIHFVLGRALEETGGGTPWVLPPAYIRHVLETCAASNRLLRNMLDAESQARMDGDQRWWDPTAYEGKKLESANITAADAETAEKLAVSLAKRLLVVEHELAALKARAFRRPYSQLAARGAARLKLLWKK
ncbi:MAG: hypothetical protein NW206_10240 [Hyphomonadaceae bacterium]|nr:hypothetical protein [Hyphomonadaceae bacterium]